MLSRAIGLKIILCCYAAKKEDFTAQTKKLKPH